jgi:hypothetical protein
MKPRNWVILAAVAALTACAAMKNRESDEQSLARYMDYAGEPVKSFTYLGQFDGWRSLGRDKVVVWTGVNNAYLLTVQQPCQELRFANRIGVTSTGNTVSSGFDSVQVGDNQTCRITEIRPVNYKDLKAAEKAGG